MGLVDGLTAQGRNAWLPEREVGACGAGVGGSEIQPYLEGGIEEAPDGARCLPIGFGEDRETRSLPDWSLAGRGRAI